MVCHCWLVDSKCHSIRQVCWCCHDRHCYEPFPFCSTIHILHFAMQRIPAFTLSVFHCDFYTRYFLSFDLRNMWSFSLLFPPKVKLYKMDNSSLTWWSSLLYLNQAFYFGWLWLVWFFIKPPVAFQHTVSPFPICRTYPIFRYFRCCLHIFGIRRF